MKHPRTLIREAVAARLIESLPKVDTRITPARISIHRSTPLFAGKLPARLVPSPRVGCPLRRCVPARIGPGIRRSQGSRCCWSRLVAISTRG
jgi:hypothetical protein